MNTKTNLITSGLIFTMVILVWPVFMAIAQPSGPVNMQFDWILDHLTLYRLQFFFAFLISPAIIYLMLSQIKAFNAAKTPLIVFGYIFLSGYLVLNSISYLSQIVLIPDLIKKNSLELTEAWYFGNSHSLAYLMNQTGYFFWAVAALILCINFLMERGLVRWIGILYTVSAALSFIAFTGLLINSSLLNSMTLYSGVLLLPVGALSIIQAGES